MEKVIFAIVLTFIIGLPFSSQAVKSDYQRKTTNSVKVFSKKQKKLNFFQRILLKKIKRKIDRQVRKKNKKVENTPKDKLRKEGLFLGLVSLTSAFLAFRAAVTIGIFVPRVPLMAIFSGISILAGVIAIILAILFLIRRKRVPKKERNKGKPWLTIFLGIFGFLISSFAIDFSFE